MRSWICLLAAGCWRIPPAPVPGPGASAPALAPCDAARWRELAATTRRAWLISLDEPRAHRPGPSVRGAWRPREPVAVLAIESGGPGPGDGSGLRGDVQIATISEGAILARWVAASALGRAAMTGAAVSPSPGAPPDPAVRIRLGYRLPTGDDAWLSVAHAPAELDGLDLRGFVPAHLRGVTWDEHPRTSSSSPPRIITHREGAILDAPQASARVRAQLTRDADLEVRGGQAGFWEISARTPRAEVDGYLLAPPVPPPRPAGTYDFSDDFIEGELEAPPRPLPPGTCLYDAPFGEVTGMILGAQPADVHATWRDPGWSTVALSAIWGTSTYYTPMPEAAGAEDVSSPTQ